MQRALATLLAATLTFGTARAVTAADRARLTIDDLLQAENLGDAWFSPEGSRIAFTRISPIAGRPSGGFEDESVVGGRVFIAARGGGKPKEILGRAGASYRVAYSDAWAPNGRGLLLLETLGGALGLAWWNAQTEKLTPLPGRPESSFAVFDWAQDRLVYAVLPEESAQRISRSQMLDRLEKKWRAAWTGRNAQVTVSSANGVFQPSEPPPGALMLADPAGTAMKIADGDFSAVFASPDGSRVAAIRSAEAIIDPLYPLGRRSELLLFEMTAAGARLIRRFEDLDVGFGSAAWSPSGDRLLVGAKRAGEKKRQARLYEIDARDGTYREIALPEDASLVDPDVSAASSLLPVGWIGNHPAAVAAVARKDAAPASGIPSVGTKLDYGESQNLRFDVYAFADDGTENLTAFANTSVNQFLAPEGAHFALVVADGALWRVAPGSSPERLSPDGGPVVVGFGVATRYPAPPLESAYFRSGTVERVALLTVEDGIAKRRVFDVRKQRFGPARNAREIVATAPDLSATVSRVIDRWAMSLVLNGRRDRTLVTVNTALNDRALAPIESFTYTAGGKPLTGWVVLPPGAKPGKPVPAIVSVYGGAVYGGEPPTFARPFVTLPVFSGQLLASEGFAVIYPSTPLGAGEDTDVMSTLAEQVVAAVDALAAKGLVDPERVGVMGQSFGGFSTAAILAKRSDRFRAGVALAGAYDWIHGYGIESQAQTLTDDGRDPMVEMKMIETGQIRLGKPFWKDPAPYIRNSPIFHVEQIDAPLLLLHGDLDLGVTGLSGAERMYNALVRAGKQPVLVRYWGEGHVASSEWAIRDQWSRITTWFNHWLRTEAHRDR